MAGSGVWRWTHGAVEMRSEEELKDEWGNDKQKKQGKLEVKI